MEPVAKDGALERISLREHSLPAVRSLIGLALFAASVVPAAADSKMTDTDGDGLTDAEETTLGTSPTDPDTDCDGVWDGEEVNMFLTDPLDADSDDDEMSDRADPQPTQPNSGFHPIFAVFKDNATGTARTQLTETHMQENHVVYAPQTAPGAPFILYQTYLSDTNGNGEFEETDYQGSAIGIMNVDGSRPRLLTDLDEFGHVADDGWAQATPYISPDGQYVVYASDRDGALPQELRLWIMGIDGSNPRELEVLDGPGPATPGLQTDADPHWGPGNMVSFKRELNFGLSFSWLYTASIDPVAGTLSNVTLRTAGPLENWGEFAPGDYDPKISPGGAYIASYRKVGNDLSVGIPPDEDVVGDFDLWVGRHTHPLQPIEASIQYINASDRISDLMPRWNQAGNKLVLWSMDADAIGAGEDGIDIHVVDLWLNFNPFFAIVLKRRNITHGPIDGITWFELMPAWDTNPANPNGIIYSAKRWSCVDEDGDGFGAGGYNCSPLDCDDGDPTINPGALEVCDDGVDDNCDGLVDAADPACAVQAFCTLEDTSTRIVRRWELAGATIESTTDLLMLPASWSVLFDCDADGDARVDYAALDTGINAAALLRGQGTSPPVVSYVGALPPGVTVVGMGDVDGDGNDDLLLYVDATDLLAAWLLDGASIVGSTPITVLPANRVVVGTGDFDADGDDDVLVQDTTVDTLFILSVEAGVAVGLNGITNLQGQWSARRATDFNGDGRDDIVARSATTGEIRLWTINASKQIGGNYPIASPGTEWIVAGVADFDGNGSPDVMTRNTSTGAVEIRLMSGTSVGSIAPVTTIGPNDAVLSCGDLP